ncbi:phosphatidate cytidylyltransferase [Dictyocaulus viviparus]|uniref:dolichol kinase n=1 Tax=Dictyocaulus viviparus TaxID=29172 RepID=A0A0D8XWE7_DICVI|nr:phosphatidate cytidylyltransferase [Dictyocaulus viviparus]
MFWLFNVFASVGFVVFVNVRGRSSTIHRKFFHLTVSLIYLSGLYCDKDFVWLSGWLMICLFVIVEVLRFFKVPPWEKTLNRSLLAFKDEQDSAVLLTPIFLLLGVFLPLFLSPSDTSPHLYHLAGVAAVGVGDSVAAIVGSKWGRTRWPGKKKTVEGSTAMALAVLMFLLLARPFCSSPRPSCTRIAVVSFVLSAVEALTTNIDNIILPTIGYLLL